MAMSRFRRTEECERLLDEASALACQLRQKELFSPEDRPRWRAACKHAEERVVRRHGNLVRSQRAAEASDNLLRWAISRD